MKYAKIVVMFFAAVVIIGCSMAILRIEAEIPDLTKKQDGVFRGTYKVPPVNDVTLDVTVKNHLITEIDIIEHVCSPIGKRAEKITSEIIKKQSLSIDTVSGATSSSKAILKAVENALQ